ncbi:MAG: hypothetical protein ACYC6V_10255, partial [Bacillota bacterium]
MSGPRPTEVLDRSLYASSLARVGFWAATLSTIFIVAFDVGVAVPALTVGMQPWQGIEAFAATYRQGGVLATVLPSLFLAPTFLILAAHIHTSTAAERKLWSLLGVAFATVYTVIISLNYLAQLTIVRWLLLRGETAGLSMLVMGNPASFFWALEVLGYAFMGLAGVFIALALPKGRLERWVGGLFIANALLEIPGTIVYVATADAFHPLILASLGAWGVAFPAATALLAV